jgi:outer membrane protein OmpA-like peptidoglycan-associated protein
MDNCREMKMRISGAVVALVLGALVLPAAAQTQAQKVLKGSQITEEALIDALVPRAQTRSIRPGGGPAAAVKPPAQGIMVVFETNSANLTADGRQKLDIVGRALNSDKLATFSFEVQGHADPRGTAEWNQRLSEERADAVRQYLVQNQGVAPDRLKPVGKGDREPLNTQYPAAAENRRVTIVTNVQ